MPRMTKKMIEGAVKSDKLIRHSEEIEYHRFREDYKRIPRGTVIIGKRVIWGFPHIKRIFTLEKGIKRNISSPEVYIEEKVDGFNVRVAKIKDNIYAFSRGGFLDPFSTEKIREMGKVKNFFEDHPLKVLCGEMIGNTPYTPPEKKFDVRFLVFDIDDGSGKYIGCGEKYRIIKKYSIDSVTQYGKQKSIKKIISIAKIVNGDEKEGIVIKSPDISELVKYVVPNADIRDISRSSHLLFDMPMRYFIHRILRSAISIRDFRFEKEKYQKKLGKAFYLNLIKALNDEKGAYEEFEITVSSEKIWNRILKHMSKEVRIEPIFKVRKNGKTRIRFRKIYKKTSKLFRDFTQGKALVD